MLRVAAENFQVFCSSDMAPQSAFFDSAAGKGSQVKLYLTGEEFPPFDVAEMVAAEIGFVTRAQVVAQAPDLDFARLDGGRAFAVEVAWDTQNPNRFYFVTSGGTNGARLWRVTLGSIANPRDGGTIEILADENLTPGAEFSGFDNITCDFKGDVFIQEDGSSSALNLSRVWKYDASEGAMTVIAHHNPRFFKDDGQSEFLSDEQETSGILDLSAVLGEGWYLLTSMAHAPVDPGAPNKQLGKLEAFEFDPPYYEEGQLMVMYLPQEAGGDGPGLTLGFDGGYFLTFAGESGFSYQVQRSSTLTPGNWQNVGAAINGAVGVQRVDVTPVNVAREFYRIEKSEAP